MAGRSPGKHSGFRYLRWIRRAFGFFLLGTLVAFSLFVAWVTRGGYTLFGDPTPHFLERYGSLVRSEGTAVPGEPNYLVEYIGLTSSSGLDVNFAVKRPIMNNPEPLPVMMLLTGHRTGRKAVHLVKDVDSVVVVALDYAFYENHHMKNWEALKHLPEIRKGLYDTPASAMLVLDYLAQQTYADIERSEFVGVSLGAPLACVIGALDRRFARVWAIQGGGDFYRLLDHNLHGKIRSKILRAPAAALLSTMVGTLAPERWVDRIAPRPFMMVNAERDERIPESCVRKLFQEARQPKTLAWVSGRHVAPHREKAIQALVDLVLMEMEPADVLN